MAEEPAVGALEGNHSLPTTGASYESGRGQVAGRRPGKARENRPCLRVVAVQATGYLRRRGEHVPGALPSGWGVWEKTGVGCGRPVPDPAVVAKAWLRV